MGSFRFEYDQGGDRQSFSFEGESITVGRDQSQDFVLDHPTVSRQHAVVVDDGGGQFRLVVLSDGGLTAVDGERIDDEARLFDGSNIHFGELQFQFRSAEAPKQRGGGQAAGGGAPGGMGQQGGGRHQTGMGQQSGVGQQSGMGQQSGGSPSGQGGPSNVGGGPGTSSPLGGSGNDGGGGELGGGDQLAQGGGDQLSQSGADNLVGEDAGGGGEDDDVHIESWDEIAQEAGDGGEGGGEQEGGQSLSDSLNPGDDRRSGGNREERTNPALVIVTVLALVGVVYMSFFQGGGGKKKDGGDKTLDRDAPPVELKVECVSPDACIEKATEAYEIGAELLDKQDAEITNLFNGYKKLLRAEKLVENAEGRSAPPEMSDMKERKQAARQELNNLFQNYKVQYFSAKKNGHHETMAEALRTIQRYFPDETAREYKWARDRKLEMKRKGIYPSRLGTGF